MVVELSCFQRLIMSRMFNLSNRQRLIGLSGPRAQPLRAAFRSCVCAAQSSTKVKLTVPCHLAFGNALFVAGSTPELGAWDVKEAVPLSWSKGDAWHTELDLPAG